MKVFLPSFWSSFYIRNKFFAHPFSPVVEISIPLSLRCRLTCTRELCASRAGQSPSWIIFATSPDVTILISHLQTAEYFSLLFFLYIYLTGNLTCSNSSPVAFSINFNGDIPIVYTFYSLNSLNVTVKLNLSSFLHTSSFTLSPGLFERIISARSPPSSLKSLPSI